MPPLAAQPLGMLPHDRRHQRRWERGTCHLTLTSNPNSCPILNLQSPTSKLQEGKKKAKKELDEYEEAEEAKKKACEEAGEVYHDPYEHWAVPIMLDIDRLQFIGG